MTEPLKTIAAWNQRTNPTDCCAKTQEACAKVAEEHFADEHWNSGYAAAGHSIATAIRKGADT